jgi:hypothetical protein
MNVDLSLTFKDARNLLNTWKSRYSQAEYPYKVVLNIFYRKFTIEKILPVAITLKSPTWQQAYELNQQKYASVAQIEIVPVLEKWVQSNRQVGMIKYTDFQNYISSASKGDANAIKGIEYTYMLHRIIDELILIWISMVNSGETKIGAISKLTGAVIANMPIEKYEVIESIFDQLGAEQYLQGLLLKELQNR